MQIYIVTYGSNSDENPFSEGHHAYFSTEELAKQYVSKLKDNVDEYDIAAYKGTLLIHLYPTKLDIV